MEQHPGKPDAALNGVQLDLIKAVWWQCGAGINGGKSSSTKRTEPGFSHERRFSVIRLVLLPHLSSFLREDAEKQRCILWSNISSLMLPFHCIIIEPPCLNVESKRVRVLLLYIQSFVHTLWQEEIKKKKGVYLGGL